MVWEYSLLSLPVRATPACIPSWAPDLCSQLGLSPQGHRGSPKPLFPLTGHTDTRQCQQMESLLPGSCWAEHRAGISSKHSCVPPNTPAAATGMLSVGVSPWWSFKGVSPYLRFCCGAGTPSAAAAHFSQPGPGALGTEGPRCHRSPMPHRKAEPASLPGHWW